jgi:hypothetical protein
VSDDDPGTPDHPTGSAAPDRSPDAGTDNGSGRSPEASPDTGGSTVSPGAGAGAAMSPGAGLPTGVGAGAGGDGVPGGSAVVVALRELAPPRHAADFWPDLDRRLADEPQLRLAPRAAIRPITQPPPVIDDSSLAGRLKGDPSPPPRRRTARTLVATAVVVLVALVVLSILQRPEDGLTTGPDGTSETTGGRTPTSDPPAEEDEPVETTAPVAVPPGTIDPAAPLEPGGVGPLRVGMRLGDLQAAGVVLQVDQETFDGSGGSCYDAQVRGALDLELRFRPPEGEGGVDDPAQGVLASIAIESARPTVRTSNTGLGLGVPQDQVLATYAGNLDERSHPFASGGSILRADNGDATGISYRTDGQTVIGVAVGYMDVIRFINQCE